MAFIPSKQRYTDAGGLAKIIASDAYERGLNPAELDILINILTKNNSLDQSTVTTLIKNAYPLQKVPSKIVTRVVCCLGSSKSKPSVATQALLVRWLVLVHDSMEDPNHLSRLYSVLFSLLDMISLRKSLCHLLSMITRRKHVKPFRIQALMSLLRNSAEDEREVLGLLRAFKIFYPDIIIGDLGGLRRANGFYFRHPDPEWPQHVKELREQNAERLMADHTSNFKVVRRGITKRGKIEAAIPDMQTSRVARNHASLEELRGVNDFIDKIDRIDLPNQIISMLGDSLGQKYLWLVQSEVAHWRLQDWLEGFLNDKLEHIRESTSDEPETLAYVLCLAVEYVRFSKVCICSWVVCLRSSRVAYAPNLQELPPAFSGFLRSYLHLWNGRDNRDQIFAMLEYIPLKSYSSARKDYFLPLEAAVLDGTLSSRAILLDYYTSLIHQLGTQIRARPFPVHSDGSNLLASVIAHAELLALSTLESPAAFENNGAEDAEPATLSVIALYDVLAELFSHASTNKSIRLTIPLAPTVYAIAFTPISSLISIFSAVLAKYKTSFEESLVSEVLQTPGNPEPLYPTEVVGQFNGYVMDICNLVWRNRALNNEDANALGCLIPPTTVAALTQYFRSMNDIARERRRDAPFFYKLSSMFSLSHHAALGNFSAACVSDIEEREGSRASRELPRLRKPVTQKALSILEKDGGVKLSWQEYRVQMLDWLEKTGSVGIASLMRSTMKALRKE